SQALVVGGDHGAGAALAGLLHQQAHHPFGVQRVFSKFLGLCVFVLCGGLFGFGSLCACFG
ncbi:MAG: hypothetical protein QW566_00810, partial [Candidatus Jordarchaeales archaeon]